MYRTHADRTGFERGTQLPLNLPRVSTISIQDLPTVFNNLFTRYQICLRDERDNFQHLLQHAVIYYYMSNYKAVKLAVLVACVLN
jgi:hypothetical protein